MQSNCDAPQGNDARAKRKRRMCAHPGCKPNIAQGATEYCIAHGGVGMEGHERRRAHAILIRQ
jgi:hypothetical protein